MPDKTSEENESNDAASGGGSKKLMTAAVLSIGMIGGGYFMGGALAGGATPAPAAVAAEAVVEETHKEMGKLVPLDAVNVNLEDGHFLRIAVTLELDPDYSSSDSHGKDEEEFPSAPAADLVLTTFSGRSMTDLSTAEGREAARVELLTSIEEKYHGKVISLYFTEFVMQ